VKYWFVVNNNTEHFFPVLPQHHQPRKQQEVMVFLLQGTASKRTAFQLCLRVGGKGKIWQGGARHCHCMLLYRPLSRFLVSFKILKYIAMKTQITTSKGLDCNSACPLFLGDPNQALHQFQKLTAAGGVFNGKQLISVAVTYCKLHLDN
jgi:hypothetical protein